MKFTKYYPLLFVVIIFIGCDAAQEAHGIIVDKATKTPIDSVAIGKGEKLDLDEPYTRRRYSKKDGSFQYNAISASSDVELYFSKKGYSTNKIEYTSTNRPDTVYLEKTK
jgi:hypothetical protein